jgi:hypothetical protein
MVQCSRCRRVFVSMSVNSSSDTACKIERFCDAHKIVFMGVTSSCSGEKMGGRYLLCADVRATDTCGPTARC